LDSGDVPPIGVGGRPGRDILFLLYLERNLNRKGVPTGNVPIILKRKKKLNFIGEFL